jgi:acyl-CoA synthetase (AMP-forming)/AMP-acid ligase II
MHFADWFQRHATTRPDALAIATPQIRLTYGEFYRALKSMVHRFAARGIKRGQTVGLCIADPALHCVAITALNRMGVVVLTLARPRAKEPVKVPCGLLVDRILIETPYDGAAEPQALEVDLAWLTNTETKTAVWRGSGFGDRDALCHIFTSSGTTGMTKAIGLSMRQIEARVLRRGIGLLAEARAAGAMCCFGLGSAGGFNQAFSAFWEGGAIFLGWPADAIASAIARNNVGQLYGSPAQLAAMLRDCGPSRFDLPSLRFVAVGGSATQPALVAAIRAKLCRSLLVAYASTEMAMTSFGPLQATDPSGSCGHLAPWMHAQAVDADDNVLPPGKEGALRFRCEDMASEYLNDLQASADHFRDGWFYPGDIGTVTRERALIVNGRVSERINAGGVKINPEHLENVLAGYDAIRECAVFGVPDALGVERIWAAIAVDREIDLDALRTFCRTKFSIATSRQFLVVEKLPRNATGKILRTELQKQAKSTVAKS